MSFPIPANETRRLAAVRELDILDTAPDIAYDEIGELAAQICQCPVAYISFMDDDRLWLKAKYGLPPDLNQCNPVENVWEYLRGNKLAITVFENYDDIVDKSCAAWRFFADDPERVASITSRTWATVIP